MPTGHKTPCSRKVKEGAKLGFLSGAAFGLAFVLFGMGRARGSGGGLLRSRGILLAPLASGAAFACFLGIGSAIRCEDDLSSLPEELKHQKLDNKHWFRSIKNE
jgi:hypothetical protein